MSRLEPLIRMHSNIDTPGIIDFRGYGEANTQRPAVSAGWREVYAAMGVRVR